MFRILCMVLNMLGCPGLGTIAGGRKRLGLCQMLLAAVGFVLSLASVGYVGIHILQSGTPPRELIAAMGEGQVLPLLELLVAVSIGVVGVMLFVCSWIWAAFTRHAPRKQAQEAELRPQPPELPGYR